MANDKKNTKELVTDDDPTAELEALTVKQVTPIREEQNLSESAADTYDHIHANGADLAVEIDELKSDLKQRSDTINQLQYDNEQLRAKWMGLETEIKAREEITDRLNEKIGAAADKLARKEKLLEKQDQSVIALQAELRDRNDEYGELKATVIEYEQRMEALNKELLADRNDVAEQKRHLLERQTGQIASAETTIVQLRAQLERVESYANSLRQLLHDQTIARDQAEDTREFLESSLKRVSELVEELRAELAEEKTVTHELGRKLDRQSDAHAEEIRILRFELGDSQETITQHELLTEQLASDLADTRGFRNELEHTLSESEEQNNARIERLKKENHRLLQEAGEHEENLASKSEAINGLLAELAKKSQKIDSIGEIENVIHVIDDRMSEHIAERSKQERDRVTRVLIGSVGGRELRFPLFKDRLTIGRTEQNDIQLKASYVSRRHAAIVTEREATRVIDWGSKNGVFVNSERITEHFLQNGDTVTIGAADFRYEERPKRDA